MVLSIGSSVPGLCEQRSCGEGGWVRHLVPGAQAGRVLRARDRRRSTEQHRRRLVQFIAQPYLHTSRYPVCIQSPRIAQYPKLLGSQPRAGSVPYPGFHKYLMGANAPAPHRRAKVMRHASVAPTSRDGQLVRSALAIGPGSYDQSPRICCLHQHVSEAANYLEKSFPATLCYIHHGFLPRISASFSQDILLSHLVLQYKSAPPSAHTHDATVPRHGPAMLTYRYAVDRSAS